LSRRTREPFFVAGNDLAERRQVSGASRCITSGDSSKCVNSGEKRIEGGILQQIEGESETVGRRPGPACAGANKVAHTRPPLDQHWLLIDQGQALQPHQPVAPRTQVHPDAYLRRGVLEPD